MDLKTESINQNQLGLGGSRIYAFFVIFILLILSGHIYASEQINELPFNFHEIPSNKKVEGKVPVGAINNQLVLSDTLWSYYTSGFDEKHFQKLDLKTEGISKYNNCCHFPVSSGIVIVSEIHDRTVFQIINEDADEKIVISNLPDIKKNLLPSDLYGDEEIIYFTGINENGITEVYKLINNENNWIQLPAVQPNNSLPKKVLITIQDNGIDDVLYLTENNKISYFNYIDSKWEEAAELEPFLIIDGICNVGDMHILLSVKSNANKENTSSNFYLFSTITDELFPTIIKGYPELSPTNLWSSNGNIMMVTREGEIIQGNPITEKYSFSILDTILFVLYFVLLIGIGYFFSKRAKTTDEYLRVKKKIPWWAAGISILATKLSAVTFLSLPVKAFATDWMYFWLPVGNIFLAIFVAKYILPFYSRLKVTTSFEYLEKRFNIPVKTVGVYTYIISELAKSGVVILIPSIVVSVVTGFDLFLCISLIGVIVAIYTFLGGIEAVIWIDVIQVTVMLCGVLAALLIVGINLDVLELKTLFKPVLHTYKLNLLDFKFDFTRATFIVIALSWIGKIQDYVANQAVVQKLVTTKDYQGTKKSTWTACLLNIPVNILFLAMGTALFLFYQSNPEKLDPTLTMPDALFVTYIVAEMPRGLIAVVIAGVFAAAMSTLAGSINSMSTTLIVNVLKHRKKWSDDKKLLITARLLIIFFGILVTLVACLVAIFEIKSLYDLVFMVIGLFGGGLAGLFILGMFTQKANSAGAIIGFLVSAIVLFIVARYSALNLFLFAPIGIFSCLIIGYVISFFFKKSKKEINGLTVFKTIKR